jgi:hypothetical protein
MNYTLIILFIVLFVFLSITTKHINNFSFITTKDGTIEIDNNIFINRDVNNIKFTNIEENTIRIKKLCIHDTLQNKINCISDTEIALLKDLPCLRKSMFCLGDACINEQHAKVLSGQDSTHIKIDPIGNTSLEQKTLHVHPWTHPGNFNLDYLGYIPQIGKTNKDRYGYKLKNQLYTIHGIDRVPSGDPTAFGAGLGSQVEIPVYSASSPQTDTPNNNSANFP